METESLEKILGAKLETVHTKLDAIKEQVIRTNGKVIKNDERICKLEAYKYKVIGWTAGVTAAGTGLIQVVMSKFNILS